jgi:hypothetical protein
VAEYRHVSIAPLGEALVGYSQIAQPRWSAWRRKQRLTDSTPEQFADVIDRVLEFAEPVLERAKSAP